MTCALFVQSTSRRACLQAMALGALTPSAMALIPDSEGVPAQMLNGEQSDRFRAWLTFIVAQQFHQGPSARWHHRDCAGLVRYAVFETLRTHDTSWRKANGLEGVRLPPKITLSSSQVQALSMWNHFDGSRQAYVSALSLVQNNSRSLGRDWNMARAGDLLFFDQGDEQHLMIWMGRWVAYHNGQTPVVAPLASSKKIDTGLRAVTPAALMQWKDTRWRPLNDNPNFTGFYRLAFLSR